MMETAKKHRHQVIICFKLFAITVRIMLANKSVNLAARNIRKQLIKYRLSGKKCTFGHSLLFECGNSKLNYAGAYAPVFLLYRTTVNQESRIKNQEPRQKQVFLHFLKS
jgi:hypothetical protein